MYLPFVSLQWALRNKIYNTTVTAIFILNILKRQILLRDL